MMVRRASLAVLMLLMTLLSATAIATPQPAETVTSVAAPLVSFPRTALTARDLGLIVNELDPVSVQVADYYQRRRGIPPENVVRVRVSLGDAITADEFARHWQRVNALLPFRVQALAIAWLAPFRVECMSITSAFAFGFDRSFCASGCERTPYSPYFNSNSHQPYTDLRIRPAMLLGSGSLQQTKAIIDRGLAADRSDPQAAAYLLNTSDPVRSVRSSSFSSVRLLQSERFQVHIANSDTIENRGDVMFYFTGLAQVDKIRANKFLAGAIADHLTSSGGVLLGSPQMSALRWLEAGATASYGTVVEPCSFTGKFPSVPIVIKRYLSGETLIEAYWKSVAMPSQGVFVGEPLAAPFGGHRVVFDGRDLLIETLALPAGRYEIVAGQTLTGPYERLRANLDLAAGRQQIRIRGAKHQFYELRPQ